MVGLKIRAGGKTIKGINEKNDTTVNMKEDRTVTITALDEDRDKKARYIIQ